MGSLILFKLEMEVRLSSETLVLTIAGQCNIPDNGILYSHRRENLGSYTELTGWVLQWRINASLVRYELGFYTSEDDMIHSHCRENLKSNIALTG
jgi:hypothetical protein